MPPCKPTLPALVTLVLSAKSVAATFGGLSEVAFLQHLAVMAQIEIAWAETSLKLAKVFSLICFETCS